MLDEIRERSVQSLMDDVLSEDIGANKTVKITQSMSPVRDY